MSQVEFPYFADPLNFAITTEGPVACPFCHQECVCLDGGGFYGEAQVDAICLRCISDGRLKELEIFTNEIDSSELTGSGAEVKRIAEMIVHCTPQLPTWQDSIWPIRGGRPFRFIKIASKLDYQRGRSEEEGKSTFVKSLHGEDGADTDWYWSMLPEHPVRNIKDGQYVFSFYLFESEDDLLTTVDAH